MNLFKSVILTGLFFGIIAGLLIVSSIILPLQHDLKDIAMLIIVVSSIIASQICIDITNSKEAFYPIFFCSSIAFLCFPFSFILYSKLTQKAIDGQWLILLSLGITTCFVSSIFTAHFREKTINNK
jgi:hypothetical protein